MKKLIFLRNGVQGGDLYYITNLLGISVYNVDADIVLMGYNRLVDKLGNDVFLNEFNKYDYIATTCPSLLSAYDYKSDPMWWNGTEYKWEIYFVEKANLGTFKNTLTKS